VLNWPGRGCCRTSTPSRADASDGRSATPVPDTQGQAARQSAQVGAMRHHFVPDLLVKADRPPLYLLMSLRRLQRAQAARRHLDYLCTCWPPDSWIHDSYAHQAPSARSFS
jgi:hypothetical protein